jgi:acyl carrier protein
MSTESILDLRALKANKNFAAKNYWKSRLGGIECKAYFAEDIAATDASVDKTYEEHTVTAPARVPDDLNRIAGSDKARHVVLLGALGIFAQKYASMEDVCFFTPMYPSPGSQHGAEGGDMVIPFRMSGPAAMNFQEYLADLKQHLISDHKYGNYPVAKKFNPEGLRPVNSTMSATGVLVESFQSVSAFEELQPDLLFIFGGDGCLTLKIRYNPRIYDASYISLLPDLYFSLLTGLINSRGEKIDDIELASEQERQKILHVFNDTDHSYAGERSLVGVFEDRVRKGPEKIAVECNGREVSFRELNRAINQLARFLLQQGIEKNELIAVHLERSVEFIVSIMAILKIGGSYVPIDRGLPEERMLYLLEDSRTKWLLTKEAHLAGKNIPGRVNRICIDREQSRISILSNSNLPLGDNGSAYLLYTSGSTGRPKGVRGTQQGLLNRLRWGWKVHPFFRQEVCCQKTNLSFVDHVVEIFSPLLKGVKLVIPGEVEAMNVQLLAGLIIERRITRITLVPSLLKSLIQVKKDKKLVMDSLRYVFCSGEVLPAQTARDFYQAFDRATLVNIYGSTEVSADVTSYTVDRMSSGRRVLIGKPIFNTQILIVDRRNRLMPVGVPGEILIAGEGVSAGYLNDPELTKNKFFPNPFYNGREVFRSGDLGRWLPDGNIEYIGRLDHQVKIRGNRIMPDEVGFVMAQHERIKEAVVIAGGEEDEKYLTGYYLSGEEIKPSDMRHFLAARLPDYMIPSYFVRLMELPLTPSGKLDRSALPLPEIKAAADYAAPSGEMEEKLVEIWANVLKLEKKNISTNAGFFELGGHSLRAMTLVNRIQGELGVDISIKDVFEYQDIRSLALFLQTAQITTYTQLKKAEERAYYSLSIAQMRLHYFYELDRYALTFNLPAVVKMQGLLDKKKLAYVFDRLIERQEVFRTSIEMVDDQPVQFIAGEASLDIEYFQADEAEVAKVVKSFIRPFDLGQAPLLRVGVIEVAPFHHYLMVDMHHIISDGSSIGLLINDFIALYNDIDLPPLELTYKDYAVWQQSASYQRKIARQKEFWVKEFSEPILPLDIPLDFSHPSTTEGDSIRFDLSMEETKQLRSLAEQEVATISMVILSVLGIMLSKIASQDDLVVGMVVAGREQVELENMIGMFPVVLPLRLYPRAGLSMRDFLIDLKSTFLSTFDNQSYQYEELARDLHLERNTSRNPWFDVMYLYQNFETSELVLPGLKISGYGEQNIAAYEKLNLTVSENEEQIFLKLVYSKALFRKDTIQRWTGYFKRIIKTLIADRNTLISQVGIIADEEKASLLCGDTYAALDRDKVFSHLLAEQAARTPSAIAVVHNGTMLTYEVLYDRSSRLAACLAAANAGPGQHVAVFLPRGIPLLTGLLAILHAGATYVPVDIDLPIQRIREMLMDSGADVIITSREVIPRVEEWELSMASIRKMIYTDDPEDQGAHFPVAGVSTEDLAYIIYTSGTTGKPKGVMVHQLGMINHLYALIEVLNMQACDVVAQTASPSFDISIWQFLAPLLAGARVYIVDKEIQQDPTLLLAALQQSGVTIFQSVPSLIGKFLDEVPAGGDHSLSGLRWMIPTGEPLSVALAVKWYDKYPDIPLLNAYGPAEASDDVTVCFVQRPGEGQLLVPVGRPIRNMRAYILDEFLNLCPIGVKGEICVAGPGVGKGYWKDEEKTAKVFVRNPFADPAEGRDYAVLYRTGDMGYYLTDHAIVYTGRRDQQVKIRGFRIELGEIQSHLHQYGGIRQVEVIAKEWAEEKVLVAYYTAEREMNTQELENYLSEKLPAYMIPSYFIYVKEFPVTPNGKLDKRALPDPDVRSETLYIAPSGEVEEKIADIWAHLLKLDNTRISTDASFFYLGGHSLSVITMINKINKEFNIKIPLKEFFRRPTVRSTAEYIEAHLWLQKTGDGETAGKTDVLI